MSGQIIGMQAWLATPPGQYLLQWERARMAASVADIFGFHALQLGLPELAALEANRMPHRWLASQDASDRQAVLVADFAALPFPANSLDLVVMPHALELTADPRRALREVERVLVPEGKVIVCGFNPVSLWGMRQFRAHLYQRFGVGSLYLPQAGEFIAYWRLRDWLRLLGFEVEQAQFGCFRPALNGNRWLQRFGWMDGIGQRWWPILGAVYFLEAVKRVHGMTLQGPAWDRSRWLASAPVTVANRTASGPGDQTVGQ